MADPALPPVPQLPLRRLDDEPPREDDRREPDEPPLREDERELPEEREPPDDALRELPERLLADLREDEPLRLRELEEDLRFVLLLADELLELADRVRLDELDRRFRVVAR